MKPKKQSLQSKLKVQSDDSDSRPPKPSSLKDFYIVEKILDRKVMDGVPKYKIKWLNYPLNQCTWEPKSNLSNVLQLIAEFDKTFDERTSYFQESEEKIKEKEPSQIKSQILTSSIPEVENISSEKAKRKKRKHKKRSKKYHSSKHKRSHKHKKSSKRKRSYSSSSSSSSNSSSSSESSNSSSKSDSESEESILDSPKHPQSLLSTEISSKKKIVQNTKPTKIPLEGKKIAIKSHKEIKPEKGSFIHGDTAVSISYAKPEGNEIVCCVNWNPRNDGTIPKPSLVTNVEIKQFDPFVLLSFYESKLKFAQLRNKKKDNEEKDGNEGREKKEKKEIDVKETQKKEENKENKVKIKNKEEESSIKPVKLGNSYSEEKQRIDISSLIADMENNKPQIDNDKEEEEYE